MDEIQKLKNEIQKLKNEIQKLKDKNKMLETINLFSVVLFGRKYKDEMTEDELKIYTKVIDKINLIYKEK